MIITKKHLSRRTVLRGFGASLALPLLDAMVPRSSALSRTAAARRAPAGRRLRAERHDHAGLDAGGEGSGFELTPMLAPLEPFRDQAGRR